MFYIQIPVDFRFKLTYVPEAEIRKKMSNSKCRDMYNLSSFLIKKNVCVYVGPFTKLVNKVIRPDFLKVACVMPVFKQGNKDVTSNCRLISILPIFSKIIEKVTSKRITEYFETNNLFSKCQFCFHQNRTADALLKFITLTLKCFENEMY